jgi:hypothetical protein
MLYLYTHQLAFEKVSKEIEKADHQAHGKQGDDPQDHGGSGIPIEWLTIKVIVLKPCTLSGLDPDSCQLFQGREHALMDHADRLWTLALQDPHARSPRSAKHRDALTLLSGSVAPFSNGDLISGFSGN